LRDLRTWDLLWEWEWAGKGTRVLPLSCKAHWQQTFSCPCILWATFWCYNVDWWYNTCN
jgi:hypothetical protein